MNLSYWANRLGLSDERDLWGEIFLIRSRYNENHFSKATVETFIISSLRKKALSKPSMKDRCLSLESMAENTDESIRLLRGATILVCSHVEDPVEEVMRREVIEIVKSKLSGKRLILFKRLLRPSKKIRRRAMKTGNRITLQMLVKDLMSVQTAQKIISEQIKPMLERASNG